MRTSTVGVILSALLLLTARPGAAAVYFTNCTDPTSGANWCPSQLTKEGWKLRYKSESSPQLMDAFWLYEVWVRDRSALACVYAGGRGGMRLNYCQALDEVD
jgi:hypothetical protein